MFNFELCDDKRLVGLEVSFNRIAIRGVIRDDKIDWIIRETLALKKIYEEVENSNLI